MGTFDDFMIDKAVKDGAETERLRTRMLNYERALQAIVRESNEFNQERNSYASKLEDIARTALLKE